MTIAILTLIPGNNLGGLFIWRFPGMDKVVHAVFYAFLAFLIFLPVAPARFSPRKFTYIVTALLILYGTSLELLQYYVPNRSFDLIDIVANGFGVAVGMVIARFYRK